MSKQLFTIEFPVKSKSASILFDFLTTQDGLQGWFADRVIVKDDVYAFTWDASTEQATLIDLEQDKFIRLHWLHSPSEEYFEFRIERSAGDNQLKLVIKDFANEKELDDQRKLWEHQVKDLLHRLGN